MTTKGIGDTRGRLKFFLFPLSLSSFVRGLESRSDGEKRRTEKIRERGKRTMTEHE